MLNVVGRLKPTVTLAAAQQDLAAVAQRLAEQYPEIKGWSANVFSVRADQVRQIRGPLLVLLAAAGLVLLIGCINVANLLITRSTLREREVAMRQALGASRTRLVTQLLVESAELALGGAVLGLIVGKLAVAMIVRSGANGPAARRHVARRSRAGLRARRDAADDDRRRTVAGAQRDESATRADRCATAGVRRRAGRVRCVCDARS